MKIIVLYGSPHRAGNSAILADFFLQGTQRCKVQHFYLNEMQIRPCQGCEKCLTNIENFCAIQDDMQQIYSAFIEADIIVFATPMYWGYMTAQMKTVIDRMEAITDRFKDKTFVVLITYRHHCQSTVAFFERVCPYFRVDLHIITCRTMNGEECDIPITAIPDKLLEACTLGKMLTKPRNTTVR